MNETVVAVVIVFAAAVIPGIVLGYLIAVKQKHTLIAGWDPARIRDPKAFGAVVGWSLIGMSVALAIVTLAWAGGTITESVFITLIVIASLVPLAGAAYAKLKYGK